MRRNSVWRVTNPLMAQAMRGLRRSNATTPHDPRPHRERSRGDARRKAIERSLRDE